ncbi:MBL fold metallo-hydrolase [Micromonospora thermarum]|uniref:MBL fold metallo-hydrolase n=1 Tax=Micromonospora thermarum TaxID=2720024 RepID=A0ABX0ZH34_9ACTN|nr:rhodanese-like domain-containing protein [Micromonospora thermarum]NJP35626.1 MBL fold metallo-hydrolase [Micromonospora thermarum]
MDLVSFRTPGLGDQTYLLTHEGKGVLVDPQRDIDRFLHAVAERDVELRFVLETHLHNDYVSGGEQAALRTGAELVLPAAAAAAYPHTAAFHLEDIKAEGLTIRPIHTPGHTPEHTSYLVLIDGESVAVFSGGSLLVASAGRPDLLGPARARTLAKLQHGSLHRLAGLPRDIALLPTHGEGSFCTATGAGRYTSTIGEELDGNPLLAVSDVEQFADQLLAAPMPIPAFYQYMGPANTLGVPPMPALTVPELDLADLADQPEGTQVLDVRPRTVQAAGFLPGSVGIEIANDFGSWAGWLLPYQAPIVLVAEPGQDVTEPVTQLTQIGIDTVRGVVRDLGEAATEQFELVDVPTFVDRLADPTAQVLDVRMPSERAAVRLDGAVERFLPDLITEGVPAEIDPDRPVLVACGSGRRAAIAATLLARDGYQPVVLTGAGVADVVAARTH